MSNAVISFPMFGDGFTMNPPRYFEIGNFRIYLYGIIIAVGFLLAAIYAMNQAKKYGLTADHALDAIIIGVPSAVVGARLFYVFNKFSNYKADTFGKTLLNIINIKNGGSAIYGGLVLVVIFIFIYCRKKKIPFGALMDLASPSLLLGQFIGRWGNFVNREAYGIETDFFAKMGLSVGGETMYVHPIFLYESLWECIGFIVLHNFAKKRKFDGQVFGLYVIWYAVGRMLCETLRHPSESVYIGDTGIKASLVVAAATAVLAIVYLIVYGSRHLNDTLYVDKVAAEAAAAAEAAQAQEEKTEEESEYRVVLEEGVDEQGNKFQYVEVEVDEDEAPASQEENKE